MGTPIHIEVFSAGMKARLNPTYRRDLELSRPHIKPPGRFEQGKQKATLPFTTRTKAFGTYVWKRH
jgi:hypothetical protein